MKPHRIPSLLFASVLFVGCSSPKVWYQAGKSFDETQRALAGCRMEAARANNPLAMLDGLVFLANESNKKAIIKNCMMSQGFSLVDKNSLPAGVTGVPK